ncbi:dienelactone hydrolase family protein [Halomonas daqingensis]|uniref:Dienelactone hydrolase family protein n=1 Tax=Billgrantia desiderata TaxID=52021 RepID=A0ABS9BDQ8_9GAMM|nr:dienelactone hydrolase family protein [Halomonas desiderata]MCE8014177.1 dienelactone hydrolase family protein [Halomonas desiderata]MCE8031356.1 dienelactone hydrolase family protein [Halomonas desiderata]MCE8045002.1 dienelactone hydrolase family protein [Halomonas desiderata]MCE8049576.1 dienelactone hydrolase family protein [Halomonas desiderata]SEG21465.1 Dienelactone hydrolase [Halomonas desiderata]
MRSALALLALPASLGLATGAHAFTPAGNDIVYEVGDETFEGYYAAASGEASGTVLIVHDWNGLDDYERQRADMLAEQGYDAFAVDLFGQGNRPETLDARQEATRALYSDRERMRELTLAGLAEAREQGAAESVVIMGYCFGGAVALEIARSDEADNVAGYTSFHGGVATPDGQEWPEEVPPLLIAHGGADTSVTMEDVSGLVEELEAIEATYEIQIYSGAPHGFTVFGDERYQQRADEQSWAAFLSLLEEVL